MELISPQLPKPTQRKPQPLSRRNQEEEETFERILATHSNPTRVFQAAQRALLYSKCKATTEAMLSQENLPGPVPFNIADPNGAPMGRNSFTVGSEGSQSRRGLAAGFAPRGIGVKGKCEYCQGDFMLNTLPLHTLLCRGRCKPCQTAGEACTRGPGNTVVCERCKGANEHKECTGFSREGEVPPKILEKCPKCGLFKVNIASHKQYCMGRCQSCVNRRIACDGQIEGGSRQHGKCRGCEDKNLECGNFSHAKEKVPGTCPTCGAHKNDLQRHMKDNCRGKCGRCAKDGEPCECTRGDNKCKRCKKQGYKCGEWPNQDHKCIKCDNMFHKNTFDKHRENCKGKCSYCIEKNIPCVRPNTSGLGACVACTEAKQKDKCDGKWRQRKPRKKPQKKQKQAQSPKQRRQRKQQKKQEETKEQKVEAEEYVGDGMETGAD